MTPSRKQQIERESIHIIHAYEKRKVVLRTPQLIAQEKLVKALAELRERNVQYTRDRKRMESEAKQERKAKRREERKAREEKGAAEKAEKRAAEEKKKDEEQELKIRIRDQRALQSLESAAKVMDLETLQKQAAERTERIDGKLEKLFDLELEARASRRGVKRARREEIVESEEDKENIEPDGEWQV